MSIPGGEPLIHKEMPQIVEGIVARKKFVYLCTNALLLEQKLDEYTPSPYLTFSIHLDGNRRAPRRVRVSAKACSTRPSPRSRLRAQRGFRVTVELHAVRG